MQLKNGCKFLELYQFNDSKFLSNRSRYKTVVLKTSMAENNDIIPHDDEDANDCYYSNGLNELGKSRYCIDRLQLCIQDEMISFENKPMIIKFHK